MSQPYRNNRGFTLIELAVSIGIASIILGVVLWNQSIYNDGASLTNLADEIGSTVSQAQVYGIGVKEFSPGSNNFGTPYGLHFYLPGLQGSNKSYIYFADLNKSKTYTGTLNCSTSAECLSKVDFTRDNYISRLCTVATPNTVDCINSSIGGVGGVDISFARPSIEAQLVLFNATGALINSPPPGLIGVKIELTSPKGAVRSVTVYKTGQVSVQ